MVRLSVRVASGVAATVARLSLEGGAHSQLGWTDVCRSFDKGIGVKEIRRRLLVMQIFLIRHGRPAACDSNPISGFELGRWVAQYNECGVDRAYPPSEAASRVVASAGIVVASNLRRSVESAEWLAPAADIQIDPELREAVLPDTVGISLRMRPEMWVVLARVLWWLNWCQSVEPRKSARQRAERAADRLCALANDHRCVAVVGHGVFNWFLAAQLARRSWRGPRRLPSFHWAVAEFVAR